MKYWIRDEDETPQGFPLKLLFELIKNQLGSSAFQLYLLRSQGYGIRINRWGSVLDTEERILVDTESFLSVSSGLIEWFYDLNAEITTDTFSVLFGLHDSTALYIDAPEEFAEELVKSFRFVRVDRCT